MTTKKSTLIDYNFLLSPFYTQSVNTEFINNDLNKKFIQSVGKQITN